MSDRVEVLLEDIRGMFRALADGHKMNAEAIQALREEQEKVSHELMIVQVQISGLRQGQGELRRGQDELRRGQDELRKDVNFLKQEVKELRCGQEELRQGQDELRREFHDFKVNTERILGDHESRLTTLETAKA